MLRDLSPKEAAVLRLPAPFDKGMRSHSGRRSRRQPLAVSEDSSDTESEWLEVFCFACSGDASDTSDGSVYPVQGTLAGEARLGKKTHEEKAYRFNSRYEPRSPQEDLA